MTADGGAEPDAVTLAYVHDATVAFSWHASLHNLTMADLAGPRRIYRGGEVAIRCASAGQLAEARNRAVAHFLADGRAPWLFWTDTDMGFAPDTLERLLAAADAEERPVVGALCFASQEVEPDGMGGWRAQATATIFDWIREGDLEGFAARADYEPVSPLACDATGMACTLIHRSALERIGRDWGPVWYDRIAAREGSVGEDLSFCMRLRDAGVPLHVHTGIRTTHLKRLWLAEGDYRRPEPGPAPVLALAGRP